VYILIKLFEEKFSHLVFGNVEYEFAESVYIFVAVAFVFWLRCNAPTFSSKLQNQKKAASQDYGIDGVKISGYSVLDLSSAIREYVRTFFFRDKGELFVGQ
jgi:hypothetical protein